MEQAVIAIKTKLKNFQQKPGAKIRQPSDIPRPSELIIRAMVFDFFATPPSFCSSKKAAPTKMQHIATITKISNLGMSMQLMKKHPINPIVIAQAIFGIPSSKGSIFCIIGYSFFCLYLKYTIYKL
ncbi:MAG: hypothetical protein WC229_01390 [Candidatus Paceibacterota bacterium]|jgi:hypothetical protein